MQVLSTERHDPVPLNASGKSFIYIRKMSGSEIYPIYIDHLEDIFECRVSQKISLLDI